MVFGSGLSSSGGYKSDCGAKGFGVGSSDSSMEEGNGVRNHGMVMNWSNSLAKKQVDIVDSCPMVRREVSFVNGEKVMVAEDTEFESDIKHCGEIVVGCFVGNRLPFMMVQKAVKKVWKLKMDFQMTLHGDSVFVFEFADEGDRTKALEHGAFHIADQLFLVRAWTPLLERELAELKTVPIWMSFYKVPIHMWNSKGLSLIASFVGSPIMSDKQTLSRQRMNYARVCVEIDVHCDFPSEVPLVVGGKRITIPVEYPWKPPSCVHCGTFGHSFERCSKRPKETAMPIMPVVDIKKQEVPKDVWIKKTGKKNRAYTTVENVEVNAEMGIGSSEQVFVQEKALNFAKESTSGVASNLEAASVTSSDPSIPPGFESCNKFHALEEEEEVSTSKLEVEDLEVSVQKPSSSEPILASNRKLSSKSKATGLFPNGTLNTGKNCFPKTFDDPNKISAENLVYYGSTMGLSFPSSKKKCQAMCSEVVKSHKGLSLEEIDESAS